MIRSVVFCLTRIAVAFVLVVAVLSQPACSDGDLKALSKSLVGLSTAVGTIQTTVLEANKRGVISDTDTRTFLQFAIKINEAGLKATEMTRKLDRLDQASRGNVLVVLKPLAQSLADAERGAGSIADQGTRTRIQGALSLIQAEMGVMQTILGE